MRSIVDESHLLPRLNITITYIRLETMDWVVLYSTVDSFIQYRRYTAMEIYSNNDNKRELRHLSEWI